jgi:hypothetical protein
VLVLARVALFGVGDVFGAVCPFVPSSVLFGVRVALCPLCALVCPLWCLYVLVLARMALFSVCDVFGLFGSLVSLCALVRPLLCSCVLVLARMV